MERLTAEDRGTFDILTEGSAYRMSIGDTGSFLVRRPRREGTPDLREDGQLVQVLAIQRLEVGLPGVLFIQLTKYDSALVVGTQRTTSPVVAIRKVI